MAADFAGERRWKVAGDRARGRRRQVSTPGAPAQIVLSGSLRSVESVPSTALPLPVRDRDDADNADDGGPRYEAPVAGDAARARRVVRQLGVVVLDRWEGTAATTAGRGRPCGPGEGLAVPGAYGVAAAAGQ